MAAGRGWRLFPIQSRSKEPLIRWQGSASSNLTTIAGWLKGNPECNWGCATGPSSGVFVVDIDGEDGRGSLEQLERDHAHLPATLVSLTARGRHLWLQNPADTSIRCSAGRLGSGIDIRGEGGYAVIPPSVHETGIRYRWEDPDQPIARAPQWLVDLVDGSTCTKGQPSPRSPILSEGHRNDGLIRLGGAMRRRGASQSEIEEALTEANARRCRPPLPDAEVIAIAKSAASYAPGGADILQTAWQAIQEHDYPDFRRAFRALCEGLQRLRPGEPVALPVQRIGALLGCHWSTIALYRREGVAAGWLRLRESAIKQALAATFEVILTSREQTPILTISSNHNQANGRGEAGASEKDLPASENERWFASEKDDCGVTLQRCPRCGAETSESPDWRLTLPLDVNIFSSRAR